MVGTLAGVFDDYDDAEKARTRLASAGFGTDAIQITPERSSYGSGDATWGGRAEHAGGLRGFFASLFGSDDDESHGHYSEAVRRGSVVLTLNVQDDRQITSATRILEESGAIDIDRRVEHWKASGYTGYDPQAKPLTRDEIDRERQTLEVMQEELKVGKRNVERGVVRVHRRVTETPVEEQVTLNQERAVVERRPVNRPATAADLAAFKEGEMEIRESSEEAVVSKTARVVEEVSIGKEATQRTETVSDTVRRTDVDVERIGEQASQPVGRRYSGIERRKSFGQYDGAERRADAAR